MRNKGIHKGGAFCLVPHLRFPLPCIMHILHSLHTWPTPPRQGLNGQVLANGQVHKWGRPPGPNFNNRHTSLIQGPDYFRQRFCTSQSKYWRHENRKSSICLPFRVSKMFQACFWPPWACLPEANTTSILKYLFFDIVPPHAFEEKNRKSQNRSIFDH